MSDTEPKAYLVKRNLFPGIFSFVFGLVVYMSTYSGIGGFAEEGRQTFYRFLGMVLAGGGLYIMKIWPWSLKEIVLEPGKVIYRRRDGKEEIYREISKTAYYRRRWGKRRVEMVAFRALDPSKGIPAVRRVSAGEIRGDFAPFVDHFHRLFGGDMGE